MAMFCQYCRAQMTSAPSHMDHERSCEKSPANALVMATCRIQALEKALKELTASVISFAPTKGVKKGHDAWMRLFNAYNAGCEALKPGSTR